MEGAPTRNPHRASAKRLALKAERSRIAWCGQEEGHRWIRSGGASPPLLLFLWHLLAQRGKGKQSPPRSRRGLSPGLLRTPEATQDDAKEETHLRQGPGPGLAEGR